MDRLSTLLLMACLALSGCVQCFDLGGFAGETCFGTLPDSEPCEAAGETGEAECTPFVEPDFDGDLMSCDGVVSDAEHLSLSAAHTYGVTDYEFASNSATYAVLFDFLPVPEDWGDWLLSAIPGVVTHAGFGQEWAGYFSRGCCAQQVVNNTWLSGFPENPTCASGGLALNPVPGAYCLDMLDGSRGGVCVYPCAWNEDCGNPAGEFCDLEMPDPNSDAPGTCRFHSTPWIPTPHEDINP